MRRMGVWVLLAALVISFIRMGFTRTTNATFTEENWKGFVYRAPWNSNQQLTVLGPQYSGVLWTQGYSDALIAKLEAGCYVRFKHIGFGPGKESRNPGTFNYRTYLKSRNMDYVCSAKPQDIQVESSVPFRYWMRLPGSILRSCLKHRLEKYMTQDSFGLLQGVMTGDTGSLSEGDTLAFRASGLSHLMAVSGTHVVYILAPFQKLFRGKKLSYRIRNVLLLFPLFLFWGIADYTPSVTRAVWMTAGILFARILERPPDGMNMLTLSAAVQMLINPFVLANSGFLMSYGAACGIYWVAPILTKKICHLKTLMVGLSVQIVLTPLMLYLFGTVSLIGVLLTMVASVPAGILCGGGYLFAVLSFLPFMDRVCQWIAYLLHALCKFLIGLANIGARLPPPVGQMRIPGVALWVVVIIYTVLCLFLLFPKQWKRIAAGTVCFAVITAFFSLVATPVLQVLVIDVGQGSATLVQADGYTGLIDTGDGATNLEEVLYAQGVTELDFVALTHGHSDHTGGLQEVVDIFSPKVLYLSQNQETGLLEAARMAEDAGVTVCPVSNGEQLHLGDVTVTFVVSELFFRQGGESMENNGSLNLHFTCLYGSILLCGDLENAAEVALEDTFSLFAPTDLLLVPHHGSKNGCSENLLSNILPKYAIISVGLQNAYGHPAPETIARLEDFGVQVYRTDVGGGISVRIGRTHLFRKKGIEVWQTL